MKMKGKGKRGISLIVLVITIIVMIILAGAIILSLNSSGIIGRANEAKNKSDLTNKKEAAGMFAAEYRIKTATGEINRVETTLEDYVKQRMEEEGLDSSDVLVTEDGNISVGTSGVKAVKAGVEIGAKVEGYEVISKSYTTSGKEVTGKSSSGSEYVVTPATISNKTDFNWIYIGNDKNGNMLITPDVSSGTSGWPIMTLSYQGGYLYGPTEIYNACKALYSTNKGTARGMNIDDVTSLLGYTKKGRYNDASKYVDTDEALTIGEISEKLGGVKLSNTKTPDGKDSWEDISKYKSNYLYITTANPDIMNTQNKSFVYPSSGTYWLASSCVFAGFRQRCSLPCKQC